MTYIHKKVPVTQILWKLSRAFPSDSAWITDAIEHVGWAIQSIGYGINFIQKSTTTKNRIIVSNHRAKLHCDIERILAVEYFADNLYNSANYMDAYGKPLVMPEEQYCKRKTIKLPLGTDITVKSLGKDSPRTTNIQPAVDYYQLNGQYIVTSFPEGELKIHYIGFDVDEEGMPYILDDFNYKEAIYWYLFQQLLTEGYKHPTINLEYANAQYRYYLPKAQNAGRMPSLDGMQSFANMFTGYVTDLNLPNNYFMHGEQRQQFDF